jgi:hypothetical protein
MVGNVPKGKPYFSVPLIWASVVLQVIGAVLLACGTIVTGLALIQKVDSFYWIVFLLGGAILSANLGFVCLLLGYRKHPCKDLSANIQLPACVEPGLEEVHLLYPLPNRSAPSVSTATLFSNFQASRERN